MAVPTVTGAVAVHNWGSRLWDRNSLDSLLPYFLRGLALVLEADGSHSGVFSK